MRTSRQRDWRTLITQTMTNNIKTKDQLCAENYVRLVFFQLVGLVINITCDSYTKVVVFSNIFHKMFKL